ncbi:hypothetical protein ACFL5Z_18890 [Planctomycetota bacterium]
MKNNILMDCSTDEISESDNRTDDIWWILEGRDYPRLWWEGSKLTIDE